MKPKPGPFNREIKIKKKNPLAQCENEEREVSH